MKSNLRKALALLLTLIMVMTSLPTSALAEMFAEASQSIQPFAGAKLRSVIKPDDENIYVTFVFKNGATEVDRQIVNQTKGESLVQPATPETLAGKRFDGWYVDGTELTFGVVSGYTATQTVEVEARFTDVYYVYFLDTAGNVYYTAEVTGATVTSDDMAKAKEYEPKDAILEGWIIQGTDNAFTGTTTVTADTYVTPVTTPAYWVTFNTDGGTGVGSKYVKQGTSVNLNQVAKPMKMGYTFSGWVDESGNTVSGTYTPTSSVVLKAQWTAAQVNYTVVYWGENADDEEYSVLATDASKTAATGTTLRLTPTTGKLPSGTKDSQHFTFKKSDTVTIASDGSSVLNVYYTRKQYTLTFQTKTSSGWWDQTTTVVATITAKYNAKISDEFGKAPFNTTYNGRAWECTESSKYDYALQTLDRMPGFDATFRSLQQKFEYQKTIYYYVQKVGTTVSDRWPSSNNNFDLLKKVDTYFNYATYTEEYHEIQGFTRYSAATAGFSSNRKNFSNNKLDLYYLRNKYNLIFTLNNYGVQTTSQVEYEASLSIYNTTPALPKGFSENAKFQGWYTVPANQITDSTKPFDFANGTMPAGDMILYAYWKEPEIKVTIDIGVEVEGGFNESSTVPAGSTIAGSDVYKLALSFIKEHNLTLVKWVDGDGERIDINQPLYKDTTITPVFAGTTYALTYVLGVGATGTAPADGNKYGPDSKARVADTSATLNGNVFVYWKDAKGNRYYPGDEIVMNANTTLTANYVPLQGRVSVTYHSNFDTDQTTVEHEGTLNNDTIKVLGYAETGLPTRDGYDFQGWATSANGTVAFAAGSSARVNSQDTNELFAVWKASENTKYKVEYYWQNVENDEFTLHEKVDKTGTTGETVTAEQKTYEGFALDTSVEGTLLTGAIAADGSLVLKLYYTRNLYTVIYDRGLQGHFESDSMYARCRGRPQVRLGYAVLFGGRPRNCCQCRL